jgi:formylglycine-generating enzyme required for sulfatase activity
MQLRLRLARILALALGLAGVSLSASAQVTPYGSGINPAGSLELTSGSPQIGTSFQLSVRNTAVANPLPGQAFLYLASQPAPGFPAGLVLPGLGLGALGSDGELLLDVLPPNPFLTLGPTLYLGGASSAATFSLSVPSNPALVGVDVFAQGLLVDPTAGPSLGLTNGLAVKLISPGTTGPVPCVSQFPGVGSPPMVIIQQGTFLMGSNAASGAPYYGQFNEKPVHQVTISRCFWMGRYEVTQAEYQALMGTNPSTFVGANMPVTGVTWFNAQDYCAALTAQYSGSLSLPAGYQFRLPTEAEWEWACRAGGLGSALDEFNVGPSLFCDQARFYFSYHSNSQCSGWQSGPAPVGSYPANAWGLHDMHGNVAEWCLDSYAAYPAGAVTDPFSTGGPGGPGGPIRVLRGGGWSSNSAQCRSAYRSNTTLFPVGINLGSIGFRVVLAPVLVP